MASAAVVANDWMDRDRSHPNLKLIDKLKRELTYDGHEKDLREMEQFHFQSDSYQFDSIHHKVTETEKMANGDRSHPNLVRLDRLKIRLTYDGWREDLKGAEIKHLQSGRGIGHFVFDHAVEKIIRKQKIHDGDRTDADVKYLDSLRLSYPGWERDVQKAMGSYLRGHSFSERYQFSFAEKQRMYEGDRSHPRLVALDALRLTYPGWEEDVKVYEERHVGKNWLTRFEGLRKSSVQIDIFKSKQETHSTGLEDTSWMHPDQRTIVNTEWTFPRWEREVERVRKSTSTLDFGAKLERLQVRQMLHDNDYTRHSLLIKLNSIEYSYPGWDKDVDNIKREVVKGIFCWKDNCEQHLQGMLNKQRAYNGYLRSMIRDIPGDEDASTNSKEHRYEGNSEKTGVKECVVCWEAPRTHVFVPCGHMCACKSCSKTLIGSTTKCPACNQTATASIEVFFP